MGRKLNILILGQPHVLQSDIHFRWIGKRITTGSKKV